jgi:hypothetical protein
MNIIHTTEKALSFHGDVASAMQLVQSLRTAYEKGGLEMDKSLNDFVFSIEVALQNAGVLNEWFEEVTA